MCFSSKNNVYRYLQFFPVIFRLGSNFQYAILLIFVWWFVFNPPRAPIHTPSCVYMHLKWSGTEFTSKNPKISTLHPNNFFLAGFCYTILYETYLIPIYRVQQYGGNSSSFYKLFERRLRWKEDWLSAKKMELVEVNNFDWSLSQKNWHFLLCPLFLA